jgi:hypothetical protein
MKKLIIVFLPLLFSLTTTFAQRNAVDDIDRENFFRIGGKAGVDINKMPGSTYGQAYNLNYEMGGFLQFNFSRRFGIQPEVNFIQSTSTPEKETSDVTNDLFYGGPQKGAPFNYMQVPILMNINVGQSRHVKLQFGPSYGFFLHQPVQSKSDNQQQQYNNGELTAISGLWIQLPFINVGGRYKYSLSSVYNQTSKETANNQAIEIFMGFTF